MLDYQLLATVCWSASRTVYARKVWRLEKILLKGSFSVVIWRRPRQSPNELCRVSNELGEEFSLLVVGDGHQSLELGPDSVRVTVWLHESEDVFHPRCYVLDPDPQGVAVCVQAACPETLDVGAKEISLLIIRGVFDGFGELVADALQMVGIVSAQQFHMPYSAGKRESLLNIGFVNRRHEYLKVTAILCFPNPCVLRENGIALEDLGDKVDVFLRDGTA